MQRGKKQSPFIGRRVPLVDEGGPILYSRYRDVSEILIDGGSNSRKRQAADGNTATAAAVNGTADAREQPPSKKSKKDKKKQHEEAAAATPAAEQPNVETAANGAPEFETDEQNALRLRREEKARKKREKQAKRAAELAAEAAAAAAAAAAAGGQQQESKQQQPEDPEGQQDQQQPEDKGNAEEAARMRSVLGFTAGNTNSNAARAAAPAAAAAAKAPPGTSFAFNFSGLSGLPAAERIAAETEAKLAAIQAVDAADKDGYVPRRVFVGGMPYSYSREQVAEYWGWCGEIEALDMLTFPDSGRFRGIVFITFESQEGADAALGYDGEQLEGQTLKVERCKAAAVAKHMKDSFTAAGRATQHKQQQQQPDINPAPQQQPAAAAGGGGSSGPGKTPGYNVAYVGNIAFEAGPDDVQALFAGCGVTKVRLHTDKNTGKSKGYAHVHFADEAGLDRALGMSGSQLHGRAIKVSYGQPKKN